MDALGEIEARIRTEREGIAAATEREVRSFDRSWASDLCPWFVAFSSRRPWLGWVLLALLLVVSLLLKPVLHWVVYWCLLGVWFTGVFACASGSTLGESISAAENVHRERLQRLDEVRDVLVDQSLV